MRKHRKDRFHLERQRGRRIRPCGAFSHQGFRLLTSPVEHNKRMAVLLEVCRHPAAHDAQTDKTDFHRRLRSSAATDPISVSSDSARSSYAAETEPRPFPNDSTTPSIALNARRVSWLHIFLNSCHRLSGFCFLAWARLLGTALAMFSSSSGSRVNTTLLRIRRLRVAT